MNLVKGIYTLCNIIDFLPKCVEPSCCVTDGFAKDSVVLFTLEEQSIGGSSFSRYVLLFLQDNKLLEARTVLLHFLYKVTDTVTTNTYSSAECI